MPDNADRSAALRQARTRGRRSSRVALGALAVAVAGCAGPQRPASSARPLLAVFEPRPKKVRLPAGLLAELQAHAARLVALAGGYRVVPNEQLRAALARRRRIAERRCRDLRCQVRLAPRLFRAHKSLAFEVTERMLAQCEVVATIYDLDQQSIDHSARVTTSCAARDLVRGVSRVVCHLSRVHRLGARPVGVVVGRGARRRGRRRRPVKIPQPSPARAAADCLARGELAWLDGELDGWSRTRPAKEEASAAAERAIELRRAYEQLGNSRHPSVAVAALCRQGTVYERLAERLASAGARVPAAVRRLGATAIAQHRRAQVSRAAPFRQQARKLYRRCLARAKAREVGGPHVDEARRRLVALDR